MGGIRNSCTIFTKFSEKIDFLMKMKSWKFHDNWITKTFNLNEPDWFLIQNGTRLYGSYQKYLHNLDQTFKKCSAYHQTKILKVWKQFDNRNLSFKAHIHSVQTWNLVDLYGGHQKYLHNFNQIFRES